MNIHEIEDQMDATENAGRTAFMENVFACAVAGMVMCLMFASCVGCSR